MTDAAALNLEGIQRILVLKLRQLGDVLLTTPVYRSLKRAFPRAEITACVFQGTEQVLEGNPDVQRCLLIPKREVSLPDKIRGQVRLWRKLRASRFDLVIDLTGSDRAATLTLLSGARRRWGVARKKGFLGKRFCYTRTVPRAPGLHVIEQQAAFLRAFGIDSGNPVLHFPISEMDRNFVRNLLGTSGDILHVHPVSRLLVKCWPAPFLAELLNKIAGHGLTPVITASTDPGELEYIASLRPLLRVPYSDLSGKLNLHQLGALSELSRCFIGSDSAPMHIAAAVGTPVIGIFGPSSETLWAPWCNQKLILSRDLPCRLPCKNKNTCPHIECLRAMTPEMVLPQVNRFLSDVLERRV